MHPIIGIHPRHEFPLAHFQSLIRRLDDPPMLLQQHFKTTILLPPLSQNIPTPIFRPVVDRYHLKIRKTLGGDAFQCLLQHLSGIVYGHQYRYAGRFHLSL